MALRCVNSSLRRVKRIPKRARYIAAFKQLDAVHCAAGYLFFFLSDVVLRLYYKSFILHDDSAGEDLHR